MIYEIIAISYDVNRFLHEVPPTEIIIIRGSLFYWTTNMQTYDLVELEKAIFIKQTQLLNWEP